jgi:4-hydroxybenzoate polyprenyltransferase
MIRVHQWMKNLLIFLPMVAAHRIGSADSLLSDARAAAFCPARQRSA